MYAGNAVEYRDIDEIIACPYHPQTVLPLNSTPEPFREARAEIHAGEDLPTADKGKRRSNFSTNTEKPKGEKG